MYSSGSGVQDSAEEKSQLSIQEAINHVIKQCIEHDCVTSAKAGMRGDADKTAARIQGDADKSALGMKRMKTNQ